MTTRSGTSYNPMGNPNHSGNPTDPPPLEEILRELTRDMHARFDKMNQEMRDLRTKTNMCLNHLEHPECPPLHECSPPPEDRNFQDQRGQFNHRPPHRVFSQCREFDLDE